MQCSPFLLIRLVQSSTFQSSYTKEHFLLVACCQSVSHFPCWLVGWLVGWLLPLTLSCSKFLACLVCSQSIGWLYASKVSKFAVKKISVPVPVSALPNIFWFVACLVGWLHTVSTIQYVAYSHFYQYVSQVKLVGCCLLSLFGTLCLLVILVVVVLHCTHKSILQSKACVNYSMYVQPCKYYIPIISHTNILYQQKGLCIVSLYVLYIYYCT
jgi:putative Mn2+ efflux pump MntP